MRNFKLLKDSFSKLAPKTKAVLGLIVIGVIYFILEIL